MMKKNMLFTSAGDNTKFYKAWNGHNMNYDIYVVYYGDSIENYNEYKKNVKYIERRKGSKFQNFFSFYTRRPDIINGYDYFFILDDDIIFKNGHEDINRMFRITSGLGVLISAPSQCNIGKISHEVTIHDKTKLLSYTNFLENGTMLFTRTSIDNLMKYFVPELVSWGVDFLAIAVNSIHCVENGIDPKTAYAIFHDIECINPLDTDKKSDNSQREIMKIAGADQRVAIWENYAAKINIPVWWNPKEFSCIYRLRRV